MLDPASLPVDRRAHRAKTDRIDLAALLRALIAWKRGERQVGRVVRVPSVEDEDRRRRGRGRERLVHERVQHLGRIKGLLMAQGIRDFAPARRDWRERLAGPRTGDGRRLPPALEAEIERECRRLWLVIDMIKAVVAERDRASAAAAVQKAALLVRFTDIGDVSAHVLVDKVFHRDFVDRREVAGFFGRASRPYRSGSIRRDQGLSRAGNPRAAGGHRAHLDVAAPPAGQRPQRLVPRPLGATRGRCRRVMVVALARKLLVALWRYLTTDTVPEGVAMAAG